jgi:ubiquinone/menaquinone biosynthesis C-methylase UbiE
LISYCPVSKLRPSCGTEDGDPSQVWTGRPGSGGHPGTVLEPQRVFEEIGLESGDTLLDGGRGGGRFSIPGAEIVGERGKVYAFDASEERLAPLREAITERNLANIEAFVDDVTKHISVSDNGIDVCLMANVFHGLVERDTIEYALREIRRVLKPDGILAAVDLKKNAERPPGPPPSVRLSPEEVEELVDKHGFKKERSVHVGPYHYLVVFST